MTYRLKSLNYIEATVRRLLLFVVLAKVRTLSNEGKLRLNVN